MHLFSEVFEGEHFCVYFVKTNIFFHNHNTILKIRYQPWHFDTQVLFRCHWHPTVSVTAKDIPGPPTSASVLWSPLLWGSCRSVSWPWRCFWSVCQSWLRRSLGLGFAWCFLKLSLESHRRASSSEPPLRKCHWTHLASRGPLIIAQWLGGQTRQTPSLQGAWLLSREPGGYQQTDEFMSGPCGLRCVPRQGAWPKKTGSWTVVHPHVLSIGAVSGLWRHTPTLRWTHRCWQPDLCLGFWPERSLLSELGRGQEGELGKATGLCTGPWKKARVETI